MGEEPITWNEIAVELERVRTQAKNRLTDSLIELESGETAEQGIMRSHRERGRTLKYVIDRIDNIRMRVAANYIASLNEPPPRPLDAVLADIRAEGHTVQLSIHQDGSVFLATSSKDRTNEDPWSLNYGEDPVAVAEGRLADIRKLHAEKLVHFDAFAHSQHCIDTDSGLTTENRAEVTCPDCITWLATHVSEPIAEPDHHILAGVGMVHIENDQDGRYAVGELAREGDERPWKVVERKEGEAPSVVFEFTERDEAESCRDALNTGAFAPLVDADPEVARELSRRLAEASEES